LKDETDRNKQVTAFIAAIKKHENDQVYDEFLSALESTYGEMENLFLIFLFLVQTNMVELAEVFGEDKSCSDAYWKRFDSKGLKLLI